MQIIAVSIMPVERTQGAAVFFFFLFFFLPSAFSAGAAVALVPSLPAGWAMRHWSPNLQLPLRKNSHVVFLSFFLPPLPDLLLRLEPELLLLLERLEDLDLPLGELGRRLAPPRPPWEYLQSFPNLQLPAAKFLQASRPGDLPRSDPLDLPLPRSFFPFFLCSRARAGGLAPLSTKARV